MTGEWLETWVKDYKPKLAPATRTSYQNNLRIHIVPAIGAIPLYELDSYHIKRMLEKAGGSCSKFVKIWNTVHGALEKAVELGMIVKNPCKLKAVSSQLGHASVKTTADIYIHLMQEQAVREVDKLSEIDKLLA